MYPLKFQPIYKQRIWGGQKLREVFSKDIPAGKKIGESWELADLPQDKSTVVNGPLASLTLRRVIEQYPGQITGNQRFSPPLPLLLKILDCQDILSVQVHPDQEACRRTGRGQPKTECWYIISAQPDAVIYKGFNQPVTPQRFLDAVREGKVAELLAKVSVQPGQCHFLPAGTVHALGPGLLLAEIQTPSDTTYRVFDWDRLDESGKARPLHISEALGSIHFDTLGENLPVTTVGRLVDCEYFKIDKRHQTQRREILFSPGTMQVLLTLTGRGTIFSRYSEPVEFKAGETVLIPAEFEGTGRFSDDSEQLVICL